MNCNLEYLYFFTRPAGTSVAFHKHSHLQLVYYISGTGSTEVNGIVYEYSQNEYALINPEILHDEKRETETDVLFIGFRYDSVPVELPTGFFKDSPKNDILRILFKLKAEMLDKKPYYEIKLNGLLQELIVEVIRSACTKTENKKGLSHIHGFLQENYSTDIDFKTLAEISGYSYHRFRHIFKEMYGCSPTGYVLGLRLNNAQKMLTETDYTVSRIAMENGFASESHFCSIFKRESGCTPMQYRKATVATKDAAAVMGQCT